MYVGKNYIRHYEKKFRTTVIANFILCEIYESYLLSRVRVLRRYPPPPPKISKFQSKRWNIDN